ncbi:hypothetical protein LEN26_006579 [Aphanomyces euteiches]|nr:hypothetical protein AeMF1_007945 [Aphanomyces euteiches]KAH9135099.1 hypothetical protein LEN26_006579 [Aphanomyces euteiches]KAH9180975.1 hypothetical protein AeNC1_017048 [Aphanomyces euteiches]
MVRTTCRSARCERFAKVDGLCLEHFRAADATQERPIISLWFGDAKAEKSRSTNDLKSVRLCRVEGCSSYARRQGRCSRHGGCIVCSVDGCATPAQIGGKCRAHGGGIRCKSPGCRAFSRAHGLCFRHYRILVDTTK